MDNELTQARTVQNNEPKAGFSEAKESASSVLGGLTDKLQRLEQAMAQEDMGTVYQVYWHELPEALQISTNKNHEIDDYLTKKIQQEFGKRFPFMILGERVSPIFLAYQVGEYYHERRTVQIDASQPTIQILPAVKDHWQKVEAGAVKIQLKKMQTEIDKTDVKLIAAKSQLEEIEKRLADAIIEKDELEHNKGFLNRKKVDEEISAVEVKIQQIAEEKKQWQPYAKSSTASNAQKQELQAEMAEIRLKEAIALKELRLIKKNFGSIAEMEKQFADFLVDFLGKEAAAND